MLAGALASCGALIGGAPARAALSTMPPRSVSFENLHTGEELKTVYWADGQYESAALRDIAWVLRDHRANVAHPIDPRLLDLLSALGAKIGHPVRYQVISGYRSPATNAMLHAASEGVATHSLHTQGMAIDIRVEKLPTANLRDMAKGLGAGGVGYYAKSDFVHVDVGRVRYW